MTKKSKIISFICIAICVLLLIGSIVCTALMFTRHIVVNNKQDIVANAQVINGVDYPSIDVESLNLLASYSDIVGGSITENSHNYETFYLAYYDELSFLPFNNYYITFSNSDFSSYGSFFTTDNFSPVAGYYIIASFTLNVDNYDYLSNRSISAFVGFHSDDLEYYLIVDDTMDEVFASSPTAINIYSFPSSQQPNTVDNIGSIIASGMTFGLDGITSSVSTAFDSVFLDNDGNLSNYSIFVFWALGVSVALGFFKYILDWILSLGSRK